MNKGFADLCLTTWLRRRSGERKEQKRKDEAARTSSARLHLIRGAGDEI